MKVPRILHYPGSKWSMADWMISHMPPHITYVEPFFGSGAVLFSKERSPLETVNDIDGEIVNLFRLIRERPEELAHAIRWTPHARQEYYESYATEVDELEWNVHGGWWFGSGRAEGALPTVPDGAV